MTKLLRRGALILDLGCGAGNDVPAFEAMGLLTVGLDISAVLLEAARERTGLRGRVVQGDLRALPFADARLDGVWAGGSLHHLPKPQFGGVVGEIARVLRPGGALGCSVALGLQDGYVEGADGMKGRRWYSYFEPDELRAVFRKHRIDVVDALFGEPSEHSVGGFVAMFARRRLAGRRRCRCGRWYGVAYRASASASLFTSERASWG